MSVQPEIITIFIIHLLISFLYYVYILTGRSFLKRDFFLLILLIPFFGFCAAVIVELLNFNEQQGEKPIGLPPLTLGEDILWKTLKSFDEEGNLIPLEEAILINDEHFRRKMMLNTLYDDPMKYLDVLLVARHNDDLETSHYATTTISHAQRNFQLEIQTLSVAVEENPDNSEFLDDYIEALENYIDSGLLEEYLLRNQRVIYSKILDRKLSLNKNDMKTLIRKIRNSIEIQDFISAVDASNILKQNWPKDEQSWIENIRVCIEGHDHKRLEETIENIYQTDITWTRHGKEQVEVWLKGYIK